VKGKGEKTELKRVVQFGESLFPSIEGVDAPSHGLKSAGQNVMET